MITYFIVRIVMAIQKYKFNQWAANARNWREE